MVVTGIFALSAHTGNAPSLTEVCAPLLLSSASVSSCLNLYLLPPLFFSPHPLSLLQAQATKFGNYFLSSKYTTVVDNLSYMLAAANALATNKVSNKQSIQYYL